MKFLDKVGVTTLVQKLKTKFQETLVSGTNIKTVNGNSLLGSGDLTIEDYSVGKHYCFARVTSNTSTAANTAKSLAWTIIRQSPSGAWTRANSNDSLVCPETGTYEINVRLSWSPTASGNYLATASLFYGDNTSGIYTSSFSGSGTRVSLVIPPIIVPLTKNQTVSVSVTTTGAGTIAGTVQYSTLTIRRIA